MAEGLIGVSGVPRGIVGAYVGLGGVARTCTEVYVGVGGVARLAWSAGKDRLYASNFQHIINELDPITMAEIRTSALYGNNVGGTRTRLYASEYRDARRLRRIDPATFAILASSTNNFFYGADGMNYTVYACSGAGVLSEIDPDTFAIIRNSSVTNFVYGIGGTAAKLIVQTAFSSSGTKFHYLDPASLALLSTIGWSKEQNRIGGNSYYFYMTNGNGFIWKKDPNTWAEVSTLVSVPYGLGIGGTKKIMI